LSGCEAEFRKAFELDPSDATAHQWFSEMLSFIGGRAQEAIDEANRARQLDPLSPIIGNAQAGAYASARQFDKAIEIAKRAIADNPIFGRLHGSLAGSYLGEHKYPQAIEEWKIDAQLEGDKNYAEFAAAAGTGFRSKRSAQGNRSFTCATQGQDQLCFSLSDRGVICRFRRQGSCLRVAQHRIPGTRRMGLRTDFVMDSLRSDPRYAELLRRMGLPQ